MRPCVAMGRRRVLRERLRALKDRGPSKRARLNGRCTQRLKVPKCLTDGIG
jgi:hypothetical protein